MPHALRPPCREDWGDAPGVGQDRTVPPRTQLLLPALPREADPSENQPSLASTEGGLKIPESVCFSNSGEIKPAYSQEIIRFPESPG